MDVIKQRLTPFLFLIFLTAHLYSQNEIKFGDKKIRIPGSEICSYTINKNSHIAKDFLEIKNGQLYYTMVEYDQGIPVRIEITECKMEYMDKSSCSLASSDLQSTYTPGQIYVIYLYTIKDEPNILTTIYNSPNEPATVQSSSMGRIHFRDLQTAENCFDKYLK